MKGKDFHFHAKRGQHEQVISLLSQYGKVSDANTGSGVMVYLTLPVGVSKRSVDRMLYNAGVPGSSRRKKKTPFVSLPGYRHNKVCQSVLEALHEKGLCYRPLLVSVNKKIEKIFVEWCIDCWIIRDWSELSPVEQRHYRTLARQGKFVVPE